MSQAATVISMAEYRKSAGKLPESSRRPANSLSEARAAMLDALRTGPDYAGMNDYEIGLAAIDWQRNLVATMRQVLAV